MVAEISSDDSIPSLFNSSSEIDNRERNDKEEMVPSDLMHFNSRKSAIVY